MTKQDNVVEEVHRFVKSNGVEAALACLTRNGYISWAAGYKIKRQDIKPEYKLAP